MKPKTLIMLFAVASFLFSGCKKEEESGDLVLNFSHHADGVNLVWNSFAFAHPAGYDYSVSHLEYYVSNIQVNGTGGILYSDANVHLIDPSDVSTLQITLKDIDFGNITSISFLLGLNSSMNVTGELPNNTANNNMAWPEPMGGGYHFLKLEGFYHDSLGVQQGYAIHIGKTQFHSDCSRVFNFDFTTDGQELELPMNLNEWFRNPALYDFEVDGSGSMYNDLAMEKLSLNGYDVFSN